LWSQFYLLDQGARLGKNISSFRATYCRAVSWPGQGFTEYRITQDAETQIPEKVADITFRLSVDDLLSLPPYMHNKIELDLPGKLRSTYDTLVNTGLFEYNTISFQCTNPAQQRNITRQFIQGGFYDKSKKWVNVNNAKISVLLEMLETINRNAIVTYQYRGELELIRKELKDASILSGTTPRAEVRNIIDKWNDGRIKALFVQVDIKLQGLNLQTGGSDIIWGALPWSLESFIQLSGRLRRPGQQADKVRMHYLLYKDTIDMRIYDALQAKQNVQNAVLSYFAANTKSFMEQEQ
jgi:SNF2 family DNA or RNA helicase